MRDLSLSRQQARTLRRLAELYLGSLRKRLATQSVGAPKQPGSVNPPWVETRLAIDRMEDAIKKLKRIETT